MISHEHRCIFIHIPRTGGTSIETVIHGESYPIEHKHLIASQAKAVYADYWDRYFKFAFVRNPWDRMVSCAANPWNPEVKGGHFGVFLDENGKIDISGYKKTFGFPHVLEHDYRYTPGHVLWRDRHWPFSVYGNMLDEPLDFIGRFESLQRDANAIFDHIGVPKQELPVTMSAGRETHYSEHYDEDSIAEVAELFRWDIEHFRFTFSTG